MRSLWNNIFFWRRMKSGHQTLLAIVLLPIMLWAAGILFIRGLPSESGPIPNLGYIAETWQIRFPPGVRLIRGEHRKFAEFVIAKLAASPSAVAHFEQLNGATPSLSEPEIGASTVAELGLAFSSFTAR